MTSTQRTLYERLLPRPDLLRPLRRATPSLSGFVLMLGLRGRSRWPAPHVLFGVGLRRRDGCGLRRGRDRSIDPTIYISAPPDSAHRKVTRRWFVSSTPPVMAPARVRRLGRARRRGVVHDKILELLAARGL